MSSRHPPRKISLLVRNLPLDTRPEELRQIFERYGDIRDVYLPQDYHTERPRGFGFVEFLDERDAEEALYNLDRSIFGGREISVVVSKESRKTAEEMYERERYPSKYRYRRRSISPYRYRRRSISPYYRNNRSITPRRYRSPESPYRRSHRSPPSYRRRRRKRSYTRSRSFSRSPIKRKRRSHRSRRSISESVSKSKSKSKSKTKTKTSERSDDRDSKEEEEEEKSESEIKYKEEKSENGYNKDKDDIDDDVDDVSNHSEKNKDISHSDDLKNESPENASDEEYEKSK